ncbi:unnamed protein product [Timema podura]|uniref:Uncharacterized protein n=1 Tax=Timema podura TaxID=61482 RepID=A0ABN7NXL6_TIMPD|nr:unnamed protein product [Timema podura]
MQRKEGGTEEKGQPDTVTTWIIQLPSHTWENRAIYNVYLKHCIKLWQAIPWVSKNRVRFDKMKFDSIGSKKEVGEQQF